MIKNKLAFTLGEVLIALGVIGVVASLVLPQLIIGQKAATARAQFDTAYSLIAKAISDMDADNVSVNPASYKAARTLYPVITKYFKVSTDCGYGGSVNESVCIKFADTNSKYKRFSGNQFDGEETALLDDGCFVLNNGMMMCVENNTNNTRGLGIMVDINGKNKNPNRLGYDLFFFEILKDGQVAPVGASGTGISGGESKNWWGQTDPTTKELKTDIVESYCNQNDNKQFSGITCAYSAATDNDYFKKLYKRH